MAEVKVLVLRTAGTNCDKETVFAFERAGANVDLLHINRVFENPALLERYQILSVPGGFSYGDDISAGKIFGVQLCHRLGDQLFDFVARDKLVLGICNGFQVLIKAGLLPAPVSGEDRDQQITLASNDSGRFEDRWVHLKSFSDKCVFIENGRMISIPVAHAEGKFIAKSNEVIDKLKANGQIVFRYTGSDGTSEGYPANPNGSMDDIAGICDPTGRILGLMPHPERHVTHTQHPHWGRFADSPPADGIDIFNNAVQYFN